MASINLSPQLKNQLLTFRGRKNRLTEVNQMIHDIRNEIQELGLNLSSRNSDLLQGAADNRIANRQLELNRLVVEAEILRQEIQDQDNALTMTVFESSLMTDRPEAIICKNSQDVDAVDALLLIVTWNYRVKIAVDMNDVDVPPQVLINYARSLNFKVLAI